MSNPYEERLRQINAQLHLELVQNTPWLHEKLVHERDTILQELEGGEKS